MKFENSGHVGHSFFNAVSENRLMDAAELLSQMLQRRMDEYAGNTGAVKTFLLSHIVIGFDLAGRLEQLRMSSLEKMVESKVTAYIDVGITDEKHTSELTQGIMREIIDNAGTEPEKPGSRLQDIQHYVQMHYSDPNLSVASISEEFGVSMSHLSRLFKKEAGVKLNDYIRVERIGRAQTLLRMTDMSVQEIAGFVGFNSASAFIRAYRENTGITPGAYREQSLK